MTSPAPRRSVRFSTYKPESASSDDTSAPEQAVEPSLRKGGAAVMSSDPRPVSPVPTAVKDGSPLSRTTAGTSSTRLRVAVSAASQVLPAPTEPMDVPRPVDLPGEGSSEEVAPPIASVVLSTPVLPSTTDAILVQSTGRESDLPTGSPRSSPRSSPRPAGSVARPGPPTTPATATELTKGRADRRETIV